MPLPSLVIAGCYAAAHISGAAVIIFKEFVYDPAVQREERKRLAEEQKCLAEEQKRLAEERQRLAEVEKRLAEEQKCLAEVERCLAEDFIDNRRAWRRGPVSISVSSTRGNGDNRGSTGSDTRKMSHAEEDSIQLDPLNINEWRNDVHPNAPGRQRTRLFPDTDEGSISTTIDESFTTLSHTPLAPTHVISNISSPFTDMLSIPAPIPTRSRTHSGSSSRTASDDERQRSTTVLFAPPSPSLAPSLPFGPILPDTPRTNVQLDPLIPLNLDEWSNDIYLHLQNVHE